MADKKRIRTRGKVPMSKYFQELKKGDRVSVIIEDSVQPRFPERIQGRTGVIEGKRGRSYIVGIQMMDMKKQFVLAPVHLKKLA